VLSIAVVDGGLDTRRFIAAYPTGVHVVGIVAVSQPRRPWSSAVGSTLATA
jgi:hypothetical protein